MTTLLPIYHFPMVIHKLKLCVPVIFYSDIKLSNVNTLHKESSMVYIEVELSTCINYLYIYFQLCLLNLSIDLFLMLCIKVEKLQCKHLLYVAFSDQNGSEHELG